MPRHTLIKLTKVKHKERILKAARERQQITYKGNLICLTADLSAEALQAKESGRFYLKYRKGKKIYNQDYSIQQGSYSKLMEIKKLSRQTKVNTIQYHQTSFQQMLKELI